MENCDLDIRLALKKLSESIEKYMPNMSALETPIQGLTLYRSDEVKAPHACMY